MEHLRKHLRRHSTRIQSRDETVIMAPTRKRSKLWNYFKKLNHSLDGYNGTKKKTQQISVLFQKFEAIAGKVQDLTTPTKKRSKLWNYFEELKPLQIKCTTCKKEMKVSHPTYYTKLMRLHLSRHGIFLDNDTLTLPDDLRQYYSELPEYKAKCNNCGETLSFLTNDGYNGTEKKTEQVVELFRGIETYAGKVHDL
ncbi:hypothetical protein DBV15_12314 [Temnothorax longispinosus]|uniref:BED-type domain-containing protein n=1 Tax=Temnothorax longispinosus TaxID=300112 RepID=A0A4S2KPZ9_9HYME|nr:hypothetical protein DBV15_12314 [Temnothorax longispinosus]